MSTENLPWHQQPNEPDFEYQAFKHYLDYGPARSYRQTALVYSRTKRTILNWAKKWNWAERLKSYENWMAGNIHSSTIEFIKKTEMEKYQFKINQSRLAFHAAQVLQRHFDNFENSAEDEHLKIRMNFLNGITGTINKLLKSVDFSLPESLQKDFYMQSHFQEIVNNNPRMKVIDTNSEEFKQLDDLLTILAGEPDDSDDAINSVDSEDAINSVDSEGEIGETNFLKPDNSIINNELQNP